MSNQYLILVSILGWGIGSLFYKIANNSIHPIMVSAIVTATFLTLTPIIFLTVDFNKSVTTTGILSTITGAVLMGAGSIAYYYALHHGDAGQTTIVTSLYPVLTLILSCIFMGEDISIRKAIGIALACASFYFLSWK